MTIEESYIRSFVAAVAAAAAVAFVVVGFAVWRRHRFGPAAMGLLGGAALVGAWVVAHQIMRGIVPISEWSVETIGRAVWPPDVTRRFPVIVFAALIGGLAADRAGGIVRWGMVAALMGAIAMLAVEVGWKNSAPAAWVAAGALGIAGGGMVAAWALRGAHQRGHGALAPAAAMMAVSGAGVVMCIAGAYSLGMVVLAGVVPIGMVCVGSRWARQLAAGMVFPVVVAGVMAAALVGGVVARAPAAIGGMPMVIAALVALGRGLPRRVPGSRFVGGGRGRFVAGAALVVGGVAVAVALR